jgi:hypothetical protein
MEDVINGMFMYEKRIPVMGDNSIDVPDSLIRATIVMKVVF